MDTSLAQSLSKLNISQANNDLAHAYGLKMASLVWEDSARNENSCLGPNISDMTLTVDGRRMCMIRKPNFSDVSCDLPIEEFSVTVGNETKDGELRRIPLREYIEQLKDFNKDTYNDGDSGPLLLDRDEHLLASAQACVLPLSSANLDDPSAKESHEVEFVPELFNYQSRTGDPAVLVIVASSQGTSAAVIDSSTQKLYFNRGGQSTQFLAKRLTRDRFERGVKLEGEMTEEEQDRNLIMIFQLPLVRGVQPGLSHHQRHQSFNLSGLKSNFFKTVPLCSKSYGTYVGDEEDEDMSFGMDDRSVPQTCALSFAPRAARAKSSSRGTIEQSSTRKSNHMPEAGTGMENAMLRVSDTDRGIYKGLQKMILKRDERFPIRVTLQHYKVSDSGDLQESDIEYIAKKISAIYDKAKAKGSLVVGKPEEQRPTAPTSKKLRPLEKDAELHKKPMFGSSCKPSTEEWLTVNDADAEVTA